MDMSLENLRLRRKEGKIFVKKNSLSEEVKKSISMLIFTLLTIIVLLSITFLLNTSQSTQKGYILTREQLDQEDFLMKSRELISKIISAQAFKTIQDNKNVLKMIAPETVIYFDPPQPTHSAPKR